MSYGILNRLKYRLRPLVTPSKRFYKACKSLDASFAKNWTLRAKLISRRIYRCFSCCISPGVRIGDGVEFPHPTGIVIGEGAVIGDHCVIYQNVTIGRARRDEPGYPKLGAGCVVYAGAVIVGDIEIAPGTVVGANAVVTRGTDVENDVLAGVPARSKLASGGGLLGSRLGLSPHGRPSAPLARAFGLVAASSKVAA